MGASPSLRTLSTMCGRYAATANPDELVEEFEVDEDRSVEPVRSILKNPQNPPPGTPDWNMAPSKQAPVVLTRVPREQREEGYAGEPAPVRQLRLLTWGLVPSWAKDLKIGMRMINARADSVLEKPSFAKAAASRRCLVPAQGWYEWQKSPVTKDAKGNPRKQPFFMHRADGEPVAFAGLYEFWRDREVADKDDPSAWLTTFTIITTDAEPGLDRIHDRQAYHPLSSFPRSAWERSSAPPACSSSTTQTNSTQSVEEEFPRRAWERGGGDQNPVRPSCSEAIGSRNFAAYRMRAATASLRPRARSPTSRRSSR
jgi:putative SOS response-associated peptidase YedK